MVEPLWTLSKTDDRKVFLADAQRQCKEKYCGSEDDRENLFADAKAMKQSKKPMLLKAFVRDVVLSSMCACNTWSFQKFSVHFFVWKGWVGGWVPEETKIPSIIPDGPLVVL